MLLRQLFDSETSTYTYLIASGIGREGIIIDPVDTHFDHYTQLIDQLGLKLVMAIDTHTHADHISARCQLHHQSHCDSVMGEHTQAECVSIKLKDSETINIDGMPLQALYTPGHTDDSYSFVINEHAFTGDALMIRGCGRTDFQNGSASDLYDSITQQLFTLPESTAVWPGHDYNGNTRSSIYEEKHFNPRLAGKSKSEFIDIMHALKLKKPAKIDIAVPANLACHYEHCTGSK